MRRGHPHGRPGSLIAEHSVVNQSWACELCVCVCARGGCLRTRPALARRGVGDDARGMNAQSQGDSRCGLPFRSGLARRRLFAPLLLVEGSMGSGRTRGADFRAGNGRPWQPGAPQSSFVWWRGLTAWTFNRVPLVSSDSVLTSPRYAGAWRRVRFYVPACAPTEPCCRLVFPPSMTKHSNDSEELPTRCTHLVVTVAPELEA